MPGEGGGVWASTCFSRTERIHRENAKQSALKVVAASEHPIEWPTDNWKYKPYRHSPSFYVTLYFILARARVASYLTQFISDDFSTLARDQNIWSTVELHFAGEGPRFLLFHFLLERIAQVLTKVLLNLTAVSGRESTAAGRDRPAYFMRPNTRPGTDSTPIVARNWDTRSLCCPCARNRHVSLDCTMFTRHRRKLS